MAIVCNLQIEPSISIMAPIIKMKTHREEDQEIALESERAFKKQKELMSFDILPNEIIAYIFEFIPTKALYPITLTCKLFSPQAMNRITRDLSFVKLIHLMNHDCFTYVMKYVKLNIDDREIMYKLLSALPPTDTTGTKDAIIMELARDEHYKKYFINGLMNNEIPIGWWSSIIMANIIPKEKLKPPSSRTPETIMHYYYYYGAFKDAIEDDLNKYIKLCADTRSPKYIYRLLASDKLKPLDDKESASLVKEDIYNGFVQLNSNLIQMINVGYLTLGPELLKILIKREINTIWLLRNKKVTWRCLEQIKPKLFMKYFTGDRWKEVIPYIVKDEDFCWDLYLNECIKFSVRVSSASRLANIMQTYNGSRENLDFMVKLCDVFQLNKKE
jgi:hypothetical protein